MKIKIYLKDPDGFEDGVAEEAYKLARAVLNEDADQKDIYCLTREKEELIREGLRKWVHYGESVVLEFDLTEGTARVQEKSQ